MTAAAVRAFRVVKAAAAQANLTRGERIPPIRVLCCRVSVAEGSFRWWRAAAISGRLGQLDCTLAGGRFSRDLQSAIRTSQSLAAEVGSVTISRLVMMSLVPRPVVAAEGRIAPMFLMPKLTLLPAVGVSGDSLRLGLNVGFDSRAGHHAAGR